MDQTISLVDIMRGLRETTIQDPAPQPTRPTGWIEARVNTWELRGNSEGSIFFCTRISTKEQINLVCTFFCPAREGDAITCEIYTDDPSGFYQIVSHPLVVPGTSKEILLTSFSKALKPGFSRKNAIELYRHIADLAGEEEPYDYISAISHLWEETRELKYLIPFKPLLSDEQALKLVQWWRREVDLRKLYLLGLRKGEINTAQERMKMDYNALYKACCDNPYIINGIPLDKCKTIMKMFDKEPTEEQQICGKIIRDFYDYVDRMNWTGMPEIQANNLYPAIINYHKPLEEEYGLVWNKGTVYTKDRHYAEINVAKEILRRLEWGPKDIHSLSNVISIEREGDIKQQQLCDEQMMAVDMAVNNPVSIITGGGGVGKSFTIKCISNNLDNLYKTIPASGHETPCVIVSFTGKAVARIKEIMSDRECYTMHRFMWKYGKHNMKTVAAPGGDVKEAKEQQSISNFRHLIIDESSMVNISLLSDFFDCFKHDYYITFVGDFNQLAPISYGNMFLELVKSRMIPMITLKKNHRITSGCEGIFVNAEHIINYGEQNTQPFSFRFDVSGFNATNGNTLELVSLVRRMYGENDKYQMIRHSINKYGKRRRIYDFAIVTPFNKIIPNLNKEIQKIFFEGGDHEKIVDKIKGDTWCIWDRVMMLHNNYDINVMNGDEGVVVGIDKLRQTITVDFKSGEHSFNINDMGPKDKFPKEVNPRFKNKNKESDKERSFRPSDKLDVSFIQLSYAMTIHKSQGSEYRYVMVYIPKGGRSRSFLDKNMLYTAETRAQNYVWLIGEGPSGVQELNEMASRPQRKKWDLLAQRLQPEGSISEQDMIKLQSTFMSGPTPVAQIEDDDIDMYL